ncbi:hypothetical protein AW27_019485 [Streptomyces sp. PCS3-D2]|uniref:hypothetical protein n=1 Tax=Streptomyces sp. PCS3-D2 TaxID=1460244 RepID=UPI000448254D|nr:hypothetical protein [Streptomyces sp. PCS3-D2]WKV73510.1 hypothetical protein AW27_019485 [Streptomyces sp. PCS3-D2]
MSGHLRLRAFASTIKDVGTDEVTARSQALRPDIGAAGLPFLHRFVELALAFHHAVRGEDQDRAAAIGRLRALTANGDFAYFTDIAHLMAGFSLSACCTERRVTRQGERCLRRHEFATARDRLGGAMALGHRHRTGSHSSVRPVIVPASAGVRGRRLPR